MAAGTWALFWRAKRNLGSGLIDISTGAALKMSLHTSAASANLLSGVTSIWSSIGNEINAATGYTAGGKSVPNVAWTASGSAMKFLYSATGVIWTATVSALSAVRFAVIRTSLGATSGRNICWVALSASGFDVASPNVLTVFPPSPAVFDLA